jgi:hypothetical protein
MSMRKRTKKHERKKIIANELQQSELALKVEIADNDAQVESNAPRSGQFRF